MVPDRIRAQLDFPGDILARNVADDAQCHVDAGGHAAGGVELFVDHHPVVGRDGTETRQQIPRLPMRPRLAPGEKTRGGEQERTGTNAEDISGGGRLIAGKTHPIRIHHDGVDSGAPGHDKKVRQPRRVAGDRRKDGQATVSAHRIQRVADQFDPPARHARQHLEGAGEIELHHVLHQHHVHQEFVAHFHPLDRNAEKNVRQNRHDAAPQIEFKSGAAAAMNPQQVVIVP